MQVRQRVRGTRRTRPFDREAVVVLSRTPGQGSALDTRTLAQGRDVGTVRVRDASGRDLPHDIPFAFAFHAFHPQGIRMLGD